jgi:hypothetical protein
MINLLRRHKFSYEVFAGKDGTTIDQINMLSKIYWQVCNIYRQINREYYEGKKNH